MKETTERRYEYFTIYVSDDGCCKNEDKKIVEAYEATIKEHRPVKLFETKQIDNPEYNNHWKIYKCVNPKEFTAALSDVCRTASLSDVCHSYHIAKRDLDDAYSQYNETEKFYAFLIEEPTGDDSWADLTVCTAHDLLTDYEDKINELEEHQQNLKKEREKLLAVIDNKIKVL